MSQERRAKDKRYYHLLFWPPYRVHWFKLLRGNPALQKPYPASDALTQNISRRETLTLLLGWFRQKKFTPETVGFKQKHAYMQLQILVLWQGNK